MIGDDAVAGGPVPFGLYACQAFARSDQVPECVRIVIVMHALHHGCDTFDPHAGVDAGLWQVGDDLVVFLRVLHENEVPDFHEPVAVFLGRSRRAAPDVIAMIVKYLRAGTAWSIRTHGPEIILGRNADDLFVRKSGPFLPQIECFVVCMIDGDQKAFRVEAPFLGEKGPGVVDRLFLEIVPETEISEHLEEGMMARRVADIIEIVVLAPCSHAFLGAGCALRWRCFQTGEGILERDHARIDEHERWIAERDKRGAGDFRMFVGGEIVEKAAADVVGRSHGEASKQSRGMRQARKPSQTVRYRRSAVDETDVHRRTVPDRPGPDARKSLCSGCIATKYDGTVHREACDLAGQHRPMAVNSRPVIVTIPGNKA